MILNKGKRQPKHVHASINDHNGCLIGMMSSVVHSLALLQAKYHVHLSVQIHLISHHTICDQRNAYQQSIHERQGRNVPTT